MVLFHLSVVIKNIEPIGLPFVGWEAISFVSLTYGEPNHGHGVLFNIEWNWFAPKHKQTFTSTNEDLL